MAEFIALRPVRGVFKHNNADNLAVVKVGSFQVVHPLDEALKLKMGQMVTHFPTDICIRPDMAEALGVANYCRTARYKNEGEKVPCRIVAARLRGVPSYGFIKVDDSIPDDTLDWFYGTWKYEPPPYTIAESGDIEREDHPQFPKYTKIKRIQLHPNAWTEGLPVRITEKLHGANSRLGVVQVDGEWRFMVGSHNVIFREFTAKGQRNSYWELLTEPIMELLNFLCDGERPVVIYGEKVGKGVQDLDYGYDTPVLRVFDIMVDGEFLSWDVLKHNCQAAGVQTVPLLFEGSFSWNIVEHMTDGSSVLQNPSRYRSNFKGREGIVITPLQETFSDVLGRRLIAKSISVDYESRRGKTTEYH